jgi:hypothetical protein
MRRILVIILFFNLIAFIGYSQTATNIKPSKFDIANFEKHQMGESYIFTSENGDYIQQVGNRKSGYVESIENKFTPYGYYKEFFPSGALRKAGPTFYGYGIGIHKTYNEKGKLIDSINIERRFSFSIDKLVKEADSLYHINLLDRSRRYNVRLLGDGSIPVYAVSIPEGTGKDTRDIEINGINGQVLSDEITKRVIKETE